MRTSNGSSVAYLAVSPDQEIRFWMYAPAVTINLAAPVSAALALMYEHDIRRLPVVVDNGELRGIITLGDIRGVDLLKVAGFDPADIASALRQVKVYEVMTWYPLAVTPETGLREAALLMREHKIGGLPVIDPASNEVVGIVTESDLFEALIHQLDRDAAFV
jgi:acetoin utilization protein AcuB/CBS domain-containing protein